VLKLRFICLIIFTVLSSSTFANKWSYLNEIDEFSDASIHIAFVRSNNGKGMAVFTCNEDNNLEMYFSVGEYIGSNGRYPIRYRVDKRKVVEKKWDANGEGTAVFVNRDRTGLAKKLMYGNQLLLEVTDFRGTPHKSKFPLIGSAESIGKVLDACTVTRVETIKDQVDISVKDRIFRWGPKSTQCNKNMLVSLGYLISDKTSSKSPDVYKALQKYIDDKYLKCGTDFGEAKGSYYCQKKERFLSRVYDDAIKVNRSFVEQCGSQYVAD